MNMFLNMLIMNLIVIVHCQSTLHNVVDTNGHELKRILIQDNYYTLVSRLDALTKTVDVLKMQNHNISLELESLKAKQGAATPDVAFYAKLTHAVTGPGRYIHYDDVILNTGNAYNPNHGVFVVPVNGTYMFSLYVCSHYNGQAVLTLYRNQTVIGTLIANDNDWTNCNSEVFILRLYVGDDVYVKTHDTFQSNLQIDTDTYAATMSGVLIRSL